MSAWAPSVLCVGLMLVAIILEIWSRVCNELPEIQGEIVAQPLARAAVDRFELQKSAPWITPLTYLRSIETAPIAQTTKHSAISRAQNRQTRKSWRGGSTFVRPNSAALSLAPEPICLQPMALRPRKRNHHV